MFSPVFLTFVTEETKVLFYFLALALNFVVTFKVIGISESSFNTKVLIESTHKLGHKLWTAIEEDFLWNSVKMEDVLVVKIGSTFGC
jgi:hypothetical protein